MLCRSFAQYPCCCDFVSVGEFAFFHSHSRQMLTFASTTTSCCCRLLCKWSEVITIVKAAVVKRLSMATDRVGPVRVAHYGNLSCSEWGDRDCRYNDGLLPPRQAQRVLFACPNACKSHSAIVDLTFATPGFFGTTRMVDNESFRDSEGK